MKSKLLGLVACWLIAATAANASPYVVTLEEVGSNVVATGNGAIDVSGLTLLYSGAGESPAIGPSVAALDFIITGPFPSYVDVYYPVVTGPTSFGTGGTTLTGVGGGDPAGIQFQGGSFDDVFVPTGYISDTPISDTATYAAASFASLGVTPGTYIWTWGRGADQSFTLQVGATPLPAALPLFATGLGALGLFGWRKKRRNAAALAA